MQQFFTSRKRGKFGRDKPGLDECVFHVKLVGRNFALFRPRLTARTPPAPFLPPLPTGPASLGSGGGPD